jgi:hypothetical protein
MRLKMILVSCNESTENGLSLTREPGFDHVQTLVGEAISLVDQWRSGRDQGRSDVETLYLNDQSSETRLLLVLRYGSHTGGNGTCGRVHGRSDLGRVDDGSGEINQ